jgi:predicted phage terminase large subunit-like protein
LASISPEEVQEAIRIRCKHDFETFVEVFFPHYCKYPFNQFHRDCFARYGQHKVARREVDGAPRGYAKSTLKTLFKPIHDLCYGFEKYILFISATDSQATEKLKDVRRELLFNDALVDCYGISFVNSRPGETSFEVSSDAGASLFKATGSGSELRGLRYGESRPTKIILDDVEDSSEVENADLRKKLKDWFFEVVRQLGTNETNIEIVGTILHRDSLLKNLEKNAAYRTKIYKAVESWATDTKLWNEWEKLLTNLDDDDRMLKADEFFALNQEAMLVGTKVLWPEKEPYDYLMKEHIEVGRRAFMKEKQNEPIVSEEALFDNIHWYYEDGDDYVIERTGVRVKKEHLLDFDGVIDPATGESKKSKAGLDFACTLAGRADTKGRLFVHMDSTKRDKPTEFIKTIFDMHDLLNFNRFGVEMNLYRNLLVENLIRERKDRETERRAKKLAKWGVKVPFYEIEARENKVKRIYTLEPKVNHGYILFNRTLSVEFMNQVQDFPKGDHDDGPDALEMLWGMVNNSYKASAISMDAMGAK